LCFEECLDNSRISKSLGYLVAVHSTGLIWRFVMIDFVSQGKENKKEEKKKLNLESWNAMILEQLTWRLVQAFFKKQYVMRFRKMIC
jgi:hypothetical protein